MLGKFLEYTAERKAEIVGAHGMTKLYRLGLVSRDEVAQVTSMRVGQAGSGAAVTAEWFDDFPRVLRAFHTTAVMGLIREGIVRTIRHDTHPRWAYINLFNHELVKTIRDHFDPVDVSFTFAKMAGFIMAREPLSTIDKNQTAFDHALQAVSTQHRPLLLWTFTESLPNNAECVAGRLDFLWFRGIKVERAFVEESVVYMRMYAPEMCRWATERGFVVDKHALRDKTYYNVMKTGLPCQFRQLGYVVRFNLFDVTIDHKEVVNRAFTAMPTADAFRRVYFYMVGRDMAPCDVDNLAVLMEAASPRNLCAARRFVLADGDTAIARRVASFLPFW